MLGQHGQTAGLVASRSLWCAVQTTAANARCSWTFERVAPLVCEPFYLAAFSCPIHRFLHAVRNVPGQSLVCFQAYNNATCGQAVGPKQCSVEGRCTHTDISNGIDESTLQSCRNNGGYVEIELFRNTSTCRADKRVYAFNTSTSGCQRVGEYYGQMSCGEYLERGGWGWVGVGWGRVGRWVGGLVGS